MKRSALASFIAVALLLVGLGAFFVTRDTRSKIHAQSAPAPGFKDSDREVDGSRFQLAGPTTTAGPTTIPGGSPAPAMTTTTTEAPQTSTGGPGTAPTGPSPAQPGAPRAGGATPPPPTIPPSVRLPPVVAPGPSATPTCSAYYLVVQVGRDTQNRLIDNPRTSIASIRSTFLRNFDQAIGVLDRATTPLAPDLVVEQTLRGRIAQMRSIVSTVTTIEQGGAVYYPLQLPRGTGEAAGWPEILDHLMRNCPDVYGSTGSTVPVQ